MEITAGFGQSEGGGLLGSVCAGDLDSIASLIKRTSRFVLLHRDAWLIFHLSRGELRGVDVERVLAAGEEFGFCLYFFDTTDGIGTHGAFDNNYVTWIRH